jgi:hypothetical protein
METKVVIRTAARSENPRRGLCGDKIRVFRLRKLPANDSLARIRVYQRPNRRQIPDTNLRSLMEQRMT